MDTMTKMMTVTVTTTTTTTTTAAAAALSPGKPKAGSLVAKEGFIAKLLS
jgi:hypothetical protein